MICIVRSSTEIDELLWDEQEQHMKVEAIPLEVLKRTVYSSED